MKNLLTVIALGILALLVVIILFTSDANAPTETATSTLPQQTNLSTDVEDGVYDINPDESTLRWTARKTLVPGYEDTGTIGVASGSGTVNSGMIASGIVYFDMETIAAEQTSHAQFGVDRLTNHLRSEDFFAVATYPTSTLTITTVESISTTTSEIDYEITADLTIKEQTNQITFPVEMGMSEDALVVRGNTTIDRTRWGIRYGSDSFFDNLGNNVIGDEVDISLMLTADQATSTNGAQTNTIN